MLEINSFSYLKVSSVWLNNNAPLALWLKTSPEFYQKKKESTTIILMIYDYIKIIKVI